MTQQLLAGRASHPKPFRVTNADRSKKKGIMADTLTDLMNKVSSQCQECEGFTFTLLRFYYCMSTVPSEMTAYPYLNLR